jgi:hypothetical protein
MVSALQIPPTGAAFLAGVAQGIHDPTGENKDENKGADNLNQSRSEEETDKNGKHDAQENDEGTQRL